MLLNITVAVPHNSNEGELHYGTPAIVDGLEWRLVATLCQRSPSNVETHVKWEKVGNPVRFAPQASLTFQYAFPANDEYVDTSKQQKSKTNWFMISEDTGTGCYIVTATVKLYSAQSTKQEIEPLHQDVGPVYHENKITEKESREEWSKTEQKCAKLIRELKEQLKGMEVEMEGFRRQKEANLEEMKLKMSESETRKKKEAKRVRFDLDVENDKKIESKVVHTEKPHANSLVKEIYTSEELMKKEIEQLKAQLETSNRKLMQAETKVGRMHLLVEETEDKMVDLEKKNEELAIQLEQNKAQNEKNQLAFKVVHKKLESAVEEKDEEVKRLERHCEDCLKENHTLHNQLVELREENVQLSHEVEFDVKVIQNCSENLDELIQKNQQLEKEIQELKKTPQSIFDLSSYDRYFNSSFNQ